MIISVAFWGRSIDWAILWRIIKKFLIISLGLAYLHLLLAYIISELLHSWLFDAASIPTGHLIGAQLNIELIYFSLQLPILLLFIILVSLQLINFTLQFYLLLDKFLNFIFHFLFVTRSKV